MSARWGLRSDNPTSSNQFNFPLSLLVPTALAPAIIMTVSAAVRRIFRADRTDLSGCFCDSIALIDDQVSTTEILARVTVKIIIVICSMH